MALVHATSVAIEGRAVLLLGPSGSGKSDLALRLIDGGAVLVSDDQTDIAVFGGRAFASPPTSIAGLIEARGIGLLRLPYLTQAPLELAVELTQAARIERLPDPASWAGGGATLPLLRLDPFEASATAKLRLALKGGIEAIMPTR